MSSGKKKRAAKLSSAERSRAWQVLEREAPRRTLKAILWHIIVPRKGYKLVPTAAGYVLIFIAIGLTFAAYSNASNILFMAVSLLVSLLLLSLLLSMWNVRAVTWNVRVPVHFRVGQSAAVQLILRNDKLFLPSYGLWFNLHLGSGKKQRLPLLQRVDPESVETVDWMFIPQRVGRDVLIVSGVESMFPFGFLRRGVGGRIYNEIVVWPRRIDYVFTPPMGRRSLYHGEVRKSPGTGNELINLREYRPGDPQKMVHWKASARLRQLVVRQIADESRDGYILHLETSTQLWRSEESFIRVREFCSSLAEDLFAVGSLQGYILDEGSLVAIKRLHDLHHFMDALALSERSHDKDELVEPARAANVISFRPEEEGRVLAYVAGSQAGRA